MKRTGTDLNYARIKNYFSPGTKVNKKHNRTRNTATGHTVKGDRGKYR